MGLDKPHLSSSLFHTPVSVCTVRRQSFSPLFSILYPPVRLRSKASVDNGSFFSFLFVIQITYGDLNVVILNYPPIHLRCSDPVRLP